MCWCPQLVFSLCFAFYRVYNCTTLFILHYTSRCGMVVHVSMFSSTHMCLMTSPTDCELDGSWITQIVHLNCCGILFNFMTLQRVYFVICSSSSSYYKLLNDIMSYMLTCTRVLLNIIVLTNTSFLRTFYDKFRHYMYTRSWMHSISKMFTFYVDKFSLEWYGNASCLFLSFRLCFYKLSSGE